MTASGEGNDAASYEAAPFAQKNPIQGHACKPLALKFFAALHTCRTCDAAACKRHHRERPKNLPLSDSYAVTKG
jgi:hypothetical protein